MVSEKASYILIPIIPIIIIKESNQQQSSMCKVH